MNKTKSKKNSSRNTKTTTTIIKIIIIITLYITVTTFKFQKLKKFKPILNSKAASTQISIGLSLLRLISRQRHKNIKMDIWSQLKSERKRNLRWCIGESPRGGEIGSRNKESVEKERIIEGEEAKRSWVSFRYKRCGIRKFKKLKIKLKIILKYSAFLFVYFVLLPLKGIRGFKPNQDESIIYI